MSVYIVHAAVLAINEAIDKGDPQQTLLQLQNPAAVLKDVEEQNSQKYHETLQTAKTNKGLKQTNDDDITEADAYDYMLTQLEIQEYIDQINEQVAEEIKQTKCN